MYRIDTAMQAETPLFLGISLLPEGRRPGLPAFTPDHRFLVVPNEETDNASIVSLEELRVIGTIALRARGRPWQAKVIPSGDVCYVTNSRFAGAAAASTRERSTLSVIDIDAGEVVKEIPVGSGPNGVTVDRSGWHGYVMNMRSNDVTVIDVATHDAIDTLLVGRAPAFGKLTHDGTILVVTNLEDASLTIVDTAHLEVMETIEVGVPGLTDPCPEWGAGDTTGVAVSADRVAYVTNWRSNTIVILNLDTGEIRKLDSPVLNPFGVEIDPLTRAVVITSGRAKEFALLDMDSAEWMGVYPNDGTAFPNGRMSTLNLWMTDPDNHRLTALLPQGLAGIARDWDRNVVTKFM